VQLRAGESADGNDIMAFAKASIGSVKAPKSVTIWNDLPRSKVGKILKSEIRASFAALLAERDAQP
jgi:fatty-acyl-CoA synthase